VKATVANVFERLIERRPPAEKTPPKPRDPAQRLLDFLQRWDGDIISTRQVRIYGPRSSRSRKNAIDAIETLARHGWLSRVKAPQRNTLQWRINRRPIANPVVAAA
jgi:hypothetical protein